VIWPEAKTWTTRRLPSGTRLQVKLLLFTYTEKNNNENK